MKTLNSAQTIAVFISIVTNIVEGLLGIRIILKMFGASSGAPFVRWIYETSQPLLTPFIGMFPSPSLSGGFVIEFTSIFALTFYLFIGYLATEAIETMMYHANMRNITEKKRKDKQSEE